MRFERGERYPVTKMRVLILVFACVLLFQVSMVKYTLDMRVFASFINSAMLISLSVIAGTYLAIRSFPLSIWALYLFPGLLIYCGYCLNIAFSSWVNPAVTRSFGLLLPWAAYLSVPFFLRNLPESEAIWRFFYRFMFLAAAIAVLEYVLVMSGLLAVSAIETPLGTFGAAGISVLHKLADGSPHDRLYGIFPEPGTFAMYVLPALMYSLVYKKVVAVVLFSVVLFLTDSLGGFISFLILLVLFVYVKLRTWKLSIGVSSVLVFIVASVTISYTFTGIADAYVSRDLSAELREQNVSAVMVGFPSLLSSYPFGMTLAPESLSNIESEDYFGSNFALGNALVIGGVFSFVGYLLVLFCSLGVSLKSLMSGIVNFDQMLVFPCLLVVFPFVVQRSTVLDSAVFAFLFAPAILRYLWSENALWQRLKVPEGGF